MSVHTAWPWGQKPVPRPHSEKHLHALGGSTASSRRLCSLGRACSSAWPGRESSGQPDPGPVAQVCVGRGTRGLSSLRAEPSVLCGPAVSVNIWKEPGSSNSGCPEEPQPRRMRPGHQAVGLGKGSRATGWKGRGARQMGMLKPDADRAPPTFVRGVGAAPSEALAGSGLELRVPRARVLLPRCRGVPCGLRLSLLCFRKTALSCFYMRTEFKVLEVLAWERKSRGLISNTLWLSPSQDFQPKFISAQLQPGLLWPHLLCELALLIQHHTWCKGPRTAELSHRPRLFLEAHIRER